jgi:subfamily B ATP-binding cassette protein MsbA
VPPLPTSFELSKEYFQKTFDHYFIQLVQDYGHHTTLLFICLGIVLLIIIGNTFRYMERMTASRIKVDVVKNMRMDIFLQRNQIAHWLF